MKEKEKRCRCAMNDLLGKKERESIMMMLHFVFPSCANNYSLLPFVI